MTDAQPAWTEGYIAEVEYTTGFYSEMAPALLCFAALLKGVHAPAIDRPFTYFELGCGQGLSANLLAAANPLGRFFANDFNPTHVLNGRALAAEAGIGNVTFLEKSFGELAGVELPEFDFITLHGVYSWISEENRRAVVDFIRRRLRPGGVVYVSYNSLPGWAPMAPLRRLMTEYAMHQPGPMPAKIAAAVDFGAKLKEAGAKYFGANPTVAPRLDRLRGQSPNYLAHEYFNLDWALLYHADVVRDMTGAKLSFVGSANLVEQFDDFVVTPKAKPVYAGITDPVLRETVKDFLLNQQFRRDVFVRGVPRMMPEIQADALAATRFALRVPRRACTPKIKVPVGQIELPEASYGPVLDALDSGARTVGELMTVPKIAALGSISQLWRSLTVLAAVGYAAPALAEAGEEERSRITERFNGAVLGRTLKGLSSPYLASPVLGTGVRVDRVDQLFLAALREKRRDIAEFAWGWLSERRQVLSKDGKPLQGAEENRKELARLADGFVGKTLPLLRRLGVAAGGPGTVEARVIRGGQPK